MSTKFFVSLIGAYLRHFRWIFIFGIVLGFLMFFIIKFIYPSINIGHPLTIGIVGRYKTDELPEYILNMIGDGLTQMSADGLPLPNLAESWQSTDNGKVWKFNLKKDINWQDGSKLTSDSVIYDFTDVTIERPDKNTLVFKLNDPFSPFPAIVSKPTFRKGLLGTAEWKVDKANLFSGYIQELTLVNKNKERVVYRFYPTLDATKTAFKLGEVDMIKNIIDPDPFQNWSTSLVKENIAYDQVVVLFFNTKDNILVDKSIRQALYYAIDKNKLGDRALSPINPNSFAFNPQVKTYEYNPDRAKELLSAIPEEQKNFLDIKIITTPLLLKTAESISQDWQKINIKSTALVSSFIPDEFQVYLTILEIPKDVDQYPLWHKTQTKTNISKFSNDRIDGLLEAGRQETDTENRRNIYLDFQRFLLEEVPAAFLYYPKYYTVTRK